jgi:Icc-related predicted phosphoesterase
VLPPSIEILLASDLHGSNACFEKLIQLTVQLKAKTLVVAGDWSGKRTVFRSSDGTSLVEDRADRTLILGDTTSKRSLGDVGVYLVESPGDTDPTARARLTVSAKQKRLRQWLDYGREQTKQIGTQLLAIPGNDDGPEIDEVLASHAWVINLDERVEHYFGYMFLGLGYSTPTPWETVRELAEPEIKFRLNRLANSISDWEHTIGVIHVPPFGTEIDKAPEITAARFPRDLPKATGWDEIHVGSTAVRDFIAERSPLAVLSGHCHDSRGIIKLSQTICINPGSFFSSRLLSAYYLRFRANTLVSHQYFLL